MQSATSSQSPSSENWSFLCGVKSESDIYNFFYSSVTHVLTSFLGLALEGPVGLLFASQVLIKFLLRCQNHNSLCFYSSVTHVLTSFLGLVLESPFGILFASQVLIKFLLRCQNHNSLCFCSSVTHVLTSFLGLVLEGPFGIIFASQVLIKFLLRCQNHNTLFPFSGPPLLLTLGASIGYGQTSFAVTLFSIELPNCDQDGVFKPTDRAVRTEGSLLSPHKTGDDLKSSSLQAFPTNGHPFLSILHDK